MNLEDVVDPEYGLQQDEWSLSNPMFDQNSNLRVIGWSGKKRKTVGHKYYILQCSICAKDTEMFGGGYYKSVKSSLVKGLIPCGCSPNAKKTKEQYEILCKRKCEKSEYNFIGFTDQWKASHTKLVLECDKHGQWLTTSIASLLSSGTGCPNCSAEAASSFMTKSDDIMIASFFASGSFHPDTKFRRSERKNTQGRPCYWFMSCPECGGTCESASNDLQRGRRSCNCTPSRQRTAYINCLYEEDLVVALKFGIANSVEKRTRQQNYRTMFNIVTYKIYEFPTKQNCRDAERECKQTLQCGIISRRDMPDGWSETTWVYNLDKIIEIYERNGGVRIEQD